MKTRRLFSAVFALMLVGAGININLASALDIEPDFETELSAGTVNLNILTGYHNANNYRCNTVVPSTGLTCTSTSQGGVATVTAPGAYTVTFEHYNQQRRRWENYQDVTVAVYNLATSSTQNGQVLAQGEKFEYTIDAENTFGDIHTTVYMDGTKVDEADGTDAIDIDTSEIGSYTVEIANTSAANAGFDESATYGFTVYGVVPKADDQAVSDEVRESVSEYVGDEISGLRENGELENENVILFFESWDDANAALARDPRIVTSIDMYEMPEEDWYNGFEASEEVMAEIKDSETIVAVHYGYASIRFGGEVYGTVYNLGTPIEMRFTIPEAVRVAPEGVTRTFYVIRGHQSMDGVNSAERLSVTREGDELVFMNDRFSSFVVVYEDVSDETETTTVAGAPNTGAFTGEAGSASAVNTAAVAMATVIVLGFGAAKFAKNRR